MIKQIDVEPPIGARCRLSENATETDPKSRLRHRLGTIVGESRSGDLWWVLWDGTKTPSNFHKALIAIIED